MATAAAIAAIEMAKRTAAPIKRSFQLPDATIFFNATTRSMMAPAITVSPRATSQPFISPIVLIARPRSTRAPAKVITPMAIAAKFILFKVNTNLPRSVSFQTDPTSPLSHPLIPESLIESIASATLSNNIANDPINPRLITCGPKDDARSIMPFTIPLIKSNAVDTYSDTVSKLMLPKKPLI